MSTAGLAIALLVLSIFFAVVAYFVQRNAVAGQTNWWFVLLNVVSIILWLAAVIILLVAHFRMKCRIEELEEAFCHPHHGHKMHDMHDMH